MDFRTDRIALAAETVKKRFGLLNQIAVLRRGKERILFPGIPVLHREEDRSYLSDTRADLGSESLAEKLLRNGTGCHGRRSEARRRPPAAPRVADTELRPVTKVRVSGSEFFGDGAVVAALLIGVADQERNWRAGRTAFIDARKNFHGIRLPALRHKAACAGTAPVELSLDVDLRQHQSSRAPVHHAADGGPVAFTEIFHPEKASDRRTRHACP